MDLSLISNRGLQDALRHNLVSFPAWVPVFPRVSRTDLQWRVALLYFVRGWSFSAIAKRYGLTHERVGQIARDWRKASIAAGYIQEIPGGPFGDHTTSAPRSFRSSRSTDRWQRFSSSQ
jgi:hypothetical protein